MTKLGKGLLAFALLFAGCSDPEQPQEAVCGDGVIDPGEECEPDRGECCDDSCHFAVATTVCRAAAGDCDVAESCTGSSATCPADVLVDSSTTCRAAAGDCDVAESCTGSSATCPADILANSSITCRAAAGDCDVAESCTGSNAVCPADILADSSTTCRAAAGDCDVAESCTGSNAVCPADILADSSTTCRAAAGDCDVAESCTGSSASCPSNLFVTSSSVCRAATGDCDIAETCTGSAAECPADLLASPGATCDDCAAGSGNCDACDGAGVCVNECGNQIVDIGEACDGSDDDSCPGFCQSSCTCDAAPSCLAYFQNGATVDGTYLIDPDGTGAISVYCDMTNGGWTYWVRSGLVAYWSFDGATPANSDLGAITGSLVGTVTQETVLPGSGFGTSVHFNQTDTNRIELANGITLPAASTVMFWTRSETCTNNRIVLVHDTTSTWLGDVRFLASAVRNSAVFQNTTDGCTPSLGSWVHSAYLDSGTAMTVYRNAGSVAPTTYSYMSFAGALLNRMGSRAGFGTNGLHGWLDDVAVFDRVLTPAEIDLIHAQGRLGRPLRWR